MKKPFWYKALDALLGIAWFLLKTAATIVFEILKLALRALAAIIKLLANTLASGAKKAGKKISETKTPKPSREPLKTIDAKTGNADAFGEWLESSESTIGLILGSRGSGKSALGMRLLENAAASGNRVYAMGFDAVALPQWISKTGTTEVPNGSVLLVDEGGVKYSSRSGFSSANKLLSALLLVARHKSLSIMFITQNSANLEINSIRQADYVIVKKPSLLQKDFERGKIRDIIEEAETLFGKHGNDKTLAFVYSDAFRGLASNTLPSFWTEKTSKAFAQE
ncbi:hypothetical protein AUJ14_05255 [Candidatus Micrarchaeota archaeon CG1_02_55_22]|nr:MAG: hypothetical protein AUJ14_05255 [Candidatus Micrarchaeota archaeon CG1_02_55_22]